MKKNICIIDDSLPVNDYSDFINNIKLIDESALKYLCKKHKEWTEEPLRGLINTILESHSDWGLSAFQNPSFYFNHTNEEIFSPDIIIFDWDYGVQSEATEEHLYNILSKTYSIIGIFTGADKRQEIEELIKSQRFEKYKDRIHLVEKGEENAISKIINETNSKFDSHFSYKFGQELKFNSIKSLDSILISISNLSFDDFVNTFGHTKDGSKKYITNNEFIEILSEKYRNYLTNEYFSQSSYEANNNLQTLTDDILRELWSYRMYYKPNDKIVRTGDIIELAGKSPSIKFLVISADCHLHKFWSKNLGSITLVPLQKIDKENTDLANKLALSKGIADYRKNAPTSIANYWVIDSLTIIPNIPNEIKDETSIKYHDYIVFPKDIFSIYIKPPLEDLGSNRKLTLSYEHFTECDATNRININEPFKTPLIQFIINQISGFGAPDYPIELRNAIIRGLNENL